MNSGFVVVLGLSPTGLYAVRELGKAGYEVAGMDSGLFAASYSRYLSTSLQCAPGKAACAALQKLAATLGERGILIPTSDAWVEWICHNHESLARHWDFAPSYADGVAASLLDKGSFHELCIGHGVAVPACWVGGAKELRARIPEVIFPCLLKPTLIHAVKPFMGGRKLFVFEDASELESMLRRLPPVDIDWMLQELIPGPESNITLYAGYFPESGSAHQGFTCRKLRQYPPGFGSASRVCSELLEETRQLSENFLQAVGFQGIAGTEFKYDERDQQLKIVEINPRPTLWFGLSHHCGKRVTLAACCDFNGCALPPEEGQANGVLWRYFFKDLYSAGYYRWHGGASVLPPPSVENSGDAGRVIGPLFDRDDLLPLWGELCNYMVKLGGRIGR
jgi:predicted ATP-grasp superfamily ATP-dependent carboligase